MPRLSVNCDDNRCVDLLTCRVYGNNIARLPPSLKKLRYLKRFMANNNQLVEVPENIMFMFVLEKLYFNGNEVATFSEVQANACLHLLPVFHMLRSVCSLTQNLCKVETLRSIFFQNNYLEHLPAEIAGLTNLTGSFNPMCSSILIHRYAHLHFCYCGQSYDAVHVCA